MIIIVAKCLLHEGKIEEFKILAEKLINESRKEEGCISYELCQDVNNKNILTFIEKWVSQEAIDIHNNSNHFTSIVPKLRQLQVGESEVNLYKII